MWKLDEKFVSFSNVSIFRVRPIKKNLRSRDFLGDPKQNPLRSSVNWWHFRNVHVKNVLRAHNDASAYERTPFAMKSDVPWVELPCTPNPSKPHDPRNARARHGTKSAPQHGQFSSSCLIMQTAPNESRTTDYVYAYKRKSSPRRLPYLYVTRISACSCTTAPCSYCGTEHWCSANTSACAERRDDGDKGVFH
jgi:hypothetical protein